MNSWSSPLQVMVPWEVTTARFLHLFSYTVVTSHGTCKGDNQPVRVRVITKSPFTVRVITKSPFTVRVITKSPFTVSLITKNPFIGPLTSEVVGLGG